MKITETITRDCCQREDLKPVEGARKIGHDPQFKFCKHCGAWWQYVSYMDAAGSTDWEYRKQDFLKTLHVDKT